MLPLNFPVRWARDKLAVARFLNDPVRLPQDLEVETPDGVYPVADEGVILHALLVMGYDHKSSLLQHSIIDSPDLPSDIVGCGNQRDAMALTLTKNTLCSIL